MKYNYKKLLGRMKEKEYTQEKLATIIGVDKATLNLKLNNKASFRQSEIEKIFNALEISPNEISLYFFTH